MRRSARYDAVADFYEQFAPDLYEAPPMVALLRLIGDVTGLQLLDLACGHGRLARELARRGGRVVGVDISEALLAKARAREAASPLQISYVHADVATPEALAGKIFDAVGCSFGLSDIDDLDGAIATVARVLRLGGFFAFSIVHPCFPGWEAKQASPSWQPGRGYYEEGWWRADRPAHGVRPRVGANHRMLSTYLNTLARHGLVVEEVAEPMPELDWIDHAPSIGPVPVYLAVRCRKRPA
ncbi:MAG TPA: class I SAM-dependent methyltransferase [Roseiflexaceae bacterium]|nr:class I SAM-dependent methyltransferase [Roseiflexaceae bacterium]